MVLRQLHTTAVILARVVPATSFLVVFGICTILSGAQFEFLASPENTLTIQRWFLGLIAIVVVFGIILGSFDWEDDS